MAGEHIIPKLNLAVRESGRSQETRAGRQSNSHEDRMSLPTFAVRLPSHGARCALRWLLLAGLTLQLALLQAGPSPAQDRSGLSSSLERGIRLGEAHTYSFELSTGDFLGAVVEQRDVDVVLALLEPQRKRVLQVDSTYGCWWEEEL